MAKAPYFITLNPLTLQVAESVVLKFQTGLAEFTCQLLDGVFGYPGHVGGTLMEQPSTRHRMTAQRFSWVIVFISMLCLYAQAQSIGFVQN
jgi:hypothetical protein